jgi:hypothetical protein
MDRRIRFYNAGDRIQDTIRYTNPAGHDTHVISMFRLDAPEAGFFDVPEESELEGAVIRHSFDRDILRDYGARGVIMIDANYKHKGTEEQDDVFPVARDDKSAIEKGKRKWTAYYLKRVEEHLNQCDQMRAAGGVPVKASGAMVRYLKLAGILDPAERAYEEQKRQTATLETLNDRLDRLERENKELRQGQQKPAAAAAK